MATAGKARAVQVPGETAQPVDAGADLPPVDELTTQAEADAHAAREVAEMAEDDAADQIAALKAQLAEANAKLAAKDAPAVQRAPIAKERHTLPEAASVDPHKITSAVLTRTGYVVPATLTPGRKF